jgi:hypothetical protein
MTTNETAIAEPGTAGSEPTVVDLLEQAQALVDRAHAKVPDGAMKVHVQGTLSCNRHNLSTAINTAVLCGLGRKAADTATSLEQEAMV